MVKLITPSEDSSDSPMLNYIRAKQDRQGRRGRDAWFHPEHDEPLIGSELGEEAAAVDEWSLRWYCPRCGSIEPPEDELAPAGMDAIHVPCASQDELSEARKREERVAVNVRNAQAFDDGAYDSTERP